MNYFQSSFFKRTLLLILNKLLFRICNFLSCTNLNKQNISNRFFKKNLLDGTEVKIAEYDPITDELDFTRGAPIVWSGK